MYTKIKEYMETNPFAVAMWLVFAVAIALRFWNLGQFNQPVFDEVYFPKYAFNYLTGEEFFHVHPPLANYFIMAGMWIYHHLPWVEAAPLGAVPFEEVNAYSYRWINALVGSFLAFLVGLVVRKLSADSVFAVIAASLVAIEGSAIVSSRYGLNSVFLVFLGFAAFYFLLKSLEAKRFERSFVILAGVMLGGVLSIKWNGLAYLITVAALYIGYAIIYGMDKYRPVLIYTDNKGESKKHSMPIFEHNFYAQVKWWELLLYLLVLPVSIYVLLYIPDRMFNTKHDFFEIHRQILWYHGQHVTADEHPYCSTWYGWPLLMRPVSYYYDRVGNIVQDVHLLGNPLIYWLGAVSIAAMVGQWCYLFFRWFSKGILNRHFYICTVILMAYFGNWLPWALVNRCIFLYHYQSALFFSMIALAYYLASMVRFPHKAVKVAAFSLIGIIVTAFIYFLPIHLGISISADAFYNRMWFREWI